MVGDQIRKLRKERHISQTVLAKHFGLTQQAIGKWETNASSPNPNQLKELAKYFNTSIDYLISGNDNIYDVGESKEIDGYAIPILGTVKAGYNAYAFNEDLGTEFANVSRPSEYFYLMVKGDSMEPRIKDGDLALVHRQATLDNGDLGVIVYGDDEGTLKKYFKNGDTIILQPFNPAYESLILTKEDLNHVYIAGKVVETKTKW